MDAETLEPRGQHLPDLLQFVAQPSGRLLGPLAPAGQLARRARPKRAARRDNEGEKIAVVEQVPVQHAGAIGAREFGGKAAAKFLILVVAIVEPMAHQMGIKRDVVVGDIAKQRVEGP